MTEFTPTGLGETIFIDRYARSPEETWPEACRRVADHVAEAETNGKVRKYGDKFYEQMANGLFSPGGRIWYGAGRSKAQLLNCFVVPTGDSREAWGKTASDTIIISGLMGGVGMNLSPIRGRDYAIKGTGGKATGSVSYGQLINGIGNTIVGGGGRRMALMLALALNHPDVEEFLSVKLDKGELTNANISLIIPDDLPSERLVEMIRNDEQIPLMFNGRPDERGRSISAKWLWDKLVTNAYESGEPGVLNGYLANEQNNIWYHKPLVCTNPCGEIWLEEYGSCDLGSLVLPNFVQDGTFNWDQLDESVRLGTRFLDNVLSVNYYPLQEIKENSEQVRRLGLGVMGLHTMLLKLGLKYSSNEARIFVDELFRTIKIAAYDESVNLAVEKGPFAAFDVKMLDSGFCKTLPENLRARIRRDGIRNCALLMIAPTGTTSMVYGVSSGVEAYPAWIYWRTFFKPDNSLATELVIEPSMHEYPERLLESTVDVPIRDHFAMQATVQKHIDNAVSKTINMAVGADVQDFSEAWLDYLPYLKGTTVYRFGSRSPEPISPIAREDWHRYFDGESKPMTADDFMAVDCVDGVCEVPVLAAAE